MRVYSCMFMLSRVCPSVATISAGGTCTIRTCCSRFSLLHSSVCVCVSLVPQSLERAGDGHPDRSAAAISVPPGPGGADWGETGNLNAHLYIYIYIYYIDRLGPGGTDQNIVCEDLGRVLRVYVHQVHCTTPHHTIYCSRFFPPTLPPPTTRHANTTTTKTHTQAKSLLGLARGIDPAPVKPAAALAKQMSEEDSFRSCTSRSACVWLREGGGGGARSRKKGGGGEERGCGPCVLLL
jgi:hypothetical protein